MGGAHGGLPEERRRRGALSELSARDTYYRTEVGKQLDKMRTAIDQQPGSVDAFKAQGDTIINASGLSEQDKAAQRDWWKNNASLAYAIAKTRENPEAVATGLGSASAGYYGRLRKQENASGDQMRGRARRRRAASISGRTGRGRTS